MLIVAMLEDRDSFLIENAEQFSSYSGYGRSWEYGGNFKTPAEPLRNIIVGIDASVNRFGLDAQFKEPQFSRDVYKCISGLFENAGEPFGTGGWGTGAFGCDPHLKAFQQLIACSSVGSPVFYCTFGKESLARTIEAFCEAFKDQTVGEMLAMYRKVIKDFVPKGQLLDKMIERRTK